MYGVVQLGEATYCKPKGREFDFRWGHRVLSFTKSFRPHYGSGHPLKEMNSSEGKGERYIEVTILPLSYAVCL